MTSDRILRAEYHSAGLDFWMGDAYVPISYRLLSLKGIYTTVAWVLPSLLHEAHEPSVAEVSKNG